jgi:hypothetical protein
MPSCRWLVSCLLLLCLSSICAAEPFSDSPPEEKPGMTPLLNGLNLQGWEGDPRLWTFKDGVVRGETTAELKTTGNTFLVWKDGVLKDFELRLSYRCTNANNSGIQYRSRRITDSSAKNRWVVRGYQFELRNENKLPNVPGFIYDEGGRARLCLVGERAVQDKEGKKVVEETFLDQEAFTNLMKIDDWNDIVIIGKKNRIAHYLNGRLIVDFTDDHPSKGSLEGVLALQLHAGAPMWTEIKDIRLRELKDAKPAKKDVPKKDDDKK